MNNTSCNYRRVTDYLDRTAELYPDKLAYEDTNRGLSFRQIKTEAYKLAAELIRLQAFKKAVGIFLPQCVEVVPAIMGVAYSGNFYSVLDVEMPASRIEKILETFRPVAIITDREHAKAAAALGNNIEIIIYEDAQDSCRYAQAGSGGYESLEAAVRPVTDKVITTDLLYVLFTSGSTGTPKGVAQPHRSVIAQHEWLAERFKLDENTTFCNQAPFYFVMSTLEVFATIRNACTTCVPPRMAFAFPGMLLDYMREKQINTVYWVPTLLCMMANMGVLEEDNLPPLKMIFPSGEVMPTKQLNMWMDAYPEATFVNQYGPTEMGDIAAYYIVDRRFKDTESLPIGKPVEYMDIMILNDANEPVKPGETGEFCGRGPSLAYGYYHNPEKTAETFVQNPLNDVYEEKIYRTGDLVYENERGELVYVTRKDFQIKHMGHRIELGEIETAASSLDGMDRSCCVYDMDRKQIVMFYTGAIEERQILADLRELIPEYMVPNRINRMKALPLNLNGKIDRAALRDSLKQEK